MCFRSPAFHILFLSLSLLLDTPPRKAAHIISPCIQMFSSSALNEVHPLSLDDIDSSYISNFLIWYTSKQRSECNTWKVINETAEENVKWDKMEGSQ